MLYARLSKHSRLINLAPLHLLKKSGGCKVHRTRELTDKMQSDGGCPFTQSSSSALPTLLFFDFFFSAATLLWLLLMQHFECKSTKIWFKPNFNGDWQTSLFLFLLVLLVLTFLEDERATLNHIFISTLLDLLRFAYTLLIFEAINLQIYVAKDMKATI